MDKNLTTLNDDVARNEMLLSMIKDCAHTGVYSSPRHALSFSIDCITYATPLDP